MYLKQSPSHRRRNRWRIRIWLLLALAYGVTGLAWLAEDRPIALVGAAATPTPAPAIEIDEVNDLAQELIARGDLYFDQGNITAALESYEEAVAAAPDLAVAYARWGRLLNLRYRTDEALIRTTRAVSLAPEDPEVLAAHAMSLTWDKQFPEAIDFAEQAIAADPEYGPAYAFLAEAYMDSQQYEQAFEMADRGVEVDPDSVWTWLNQAYVNENWGYYDVAVLSYQEAIQVTPLSYLYNSLGRIELYGNGNTDAAIEQFRQATVVDPRNPEAYAELANLYIGLEDPTTALEYAAEGVKQDPTFGRNHALLGQIYYSQLNFEAAVESFEQAVSFGYSNETIFTLLGLAHAYLEQCDQALPWLERALQSNAESQPAQAGMSICGPEAVPDTSEPTPEPTT